jgi:hypothetical protein
MKMRIAILAACASMLALTQTAVARANYGSASESKSPMRIADGGPEPAIKIAQSGVDIGAFETQRKKGKTAGSGKTTGDGSTVVRRGTVVVRDFKNRRRQLPVGSQMDTRGKQR